MMNEGWKCPQCGRVFAPWVQECPYCSGQYVGSDPSRTDDPILREPTTGDPLPNVHPKIISMTKVKGDPADLLMKGDDDVS